MTPWRERLRALVKRRRDDEPPRLLVFGKCPAWDDHMEPQGTGSDRLREVHRRLYLEGIAQAVSAGTWERLEPSHRCPRYDAACAHALVGAARRVIGGLWSSRDAGGRDRFPIVVTAETHQAIPAESVWAHLETLADALQNESDHHEAARRTQQAEATLVERCTPGDEASPSQWTPPEGWNTDVGWRRTLRDMAVRLKSYGADGGDTRSRATPAPRHVRTPRACSHVAQEVEWWLGFADALLRPMTPVWVFAPVGTMYTDFIIGTPTSDDFGCLLKNERSIAPSALIDFELGDVPDHWIDKQLQSLQQDRGDPPTH